jgi:hypothetical protein
MRNILNFIRQKLNIRDVSFANLFCRKIAIRVGVFAILSIVLLNICQPIIIDYNTKIIEYQLENTTSEIMQILDLDLPDDQTALTTHIILSKSYEQLINNAFVTDFSISLYNLNKKSVVARSLEVPTIDSHDAILWWQTQTSATNAFPKIFLSEETLAFCNKHNGSDIYIDHMCCVNSLLMPTMISAKNKNGKVLEEKEIATPSIADKTFESQVKLDLVGNDESDVVYKLMGDVVFTTSEEPRKDDRQWLNATTKTIVAYPSIDDSVNLNILSKQILINDTHYQIDCGYQISMWRGAWLQIILFEIIGLFLCVGLAFINTKETLAVHR